MSSGPGSSGEVTSAAARYGRKPSIYDVAKVAGVSHQTVSRVLNGHPSIRESTRQKVLAAIEETRYTRNSIARALATSRTMRIGVLVENPVEYGPNSTMRALEAAARAAGYAVSAVSALDEEGIDPGVRNLVEQGIDALCVVAPRVSSIRELRQLPTGVPTLVIKSTPDEHLLTAAVDQRAGATAAVEHLVGLGHREILHLAGPLDWFDARMREQSWRDVLTEHGLETVPAIVGDWTSDFGYQVGLDAQEIDRATAVFVANDQMAQGLIHGLVDRGLTVPGDISVVGFDDGPESRHLLPPLTTVRQDFQALGRLSIEMLIASIEGAEPPEQNRIQPELVVRKSTAAPRRAGSERTS